MRKIRHINSNNYYINRCTRHICMGLHAQKLAGQMRWVSLKTGSFAVWSLKDFCKDFWLALRWCASLTLPVSQFSKGSSKVSRYLHNTLKWKTQEIFGLLSIWNKGLNTDGYSNILLLNETLNFPHLQSLTKSTLSSANQWKHLRNNNRVKRATKRGEKSSRNTVKARHVSVTAYQERSIRC